ncbi:DUF2789 domain-containing protein [Mangrovitalea sediminis]|uniref:DUF2789 domain-containing protein n=1 Tax=Mangrovitalea sediminis TaxID=1982043 RepID=UPI000BE4EC6E|nr:DUF2789 domain-containing protein [Mangrovitalea sediminis]
MDTSPHTLQTLFAQLGLPSDAGAITDFIARHAPLDPDVTLPDAKFWTAAQARFLREGVSNDADWAEAIDSLDAQLRH